MKTSNVILVLLAILFTSCTQMTEIAPTEPIAVPSTLTPVPTEQITEPQLDQEFQIQFGERVTIDGEGLTIKFMSLEGDSRCPQGVVCVWQGNAEVILEVSEQEISLNTALDPREMVVGQYRIQLRDVLPYPQAGEEYQPYDYRIKIVVSKS